MYKLLKYKEHFCEQVILGEHIQAAEKFERFFPKKRNPELAKCLGIYPTTMGHRVECSYFIGVDWIQQNQAVYVEPKLNSDLGQTHYLKMLFDGLQNPEAAERVEDLFFIDFDARPIEIEQQEDLLTPLLVVHFLQLLRHIVKKGLKKSYYKVTHNGQARIKGKILVSDTLKRNHARGKYLNTFCAYEEFGVNGIENRLLKTALLFIQKYISNTTRFGTERYVRDSLHYIAPAFELVSETSYIQELKQVKPNSFYKEYESALKLAQMILKRFGYTISNASEKGRVKTPPFWIDMSLLFEIYVFNLLKTEFNTAILYQVRGKRWVPDFLLKSDMHRMIVDAKYKPSYANKNNYDPDDIRQLSGYARDTKLLKELGLSENEMATKVIECLIIYPDNEYLGAATTERIDLLRKEEIPGFLLFNKLVVKLPAIGERIEI